MKELVISSKNARALYPSASDKFKTMLVDTFGEDFFNQKITDRIKTYEDACEYLNISPSDLPDVSKCQEKDSDSIIAYHKLIIIIRALNEGWEPDWSNHDEYKYYNYLYINTAGFVCSDANYTPSDAYAYIGSRLCFKNKELAVYAVEQFIELYKEYLLIK